MTELRNSVKVEVDVLLGSLSLIHGVLKVSADAVNDTERTTVFVCNVHCCPKAALQPENT